MFSSAPLSTTSLSAEGIVIGGVTVELVTVTSKDTFTGSNGTLLTAHTPDIGNGWTLEEGTALEITSNRATQPAATNTTMAVETSTSDVVVEATLGQGDVNTKVGLAFRLQDADHTWRVTITNTAIALQYIDTSAFQRGTYFPPGGTIDTAFAIKVVAIGDQIEVYVDGVLQMEWTDTLLQTETKCGIFAQNDGGANQHIDDFKVSGPFTLHATGSVGTVAVDFDSTIAVTGVAGTGAVGTTT
ncbi:unnamed protein product, partial [marine sediment metagenome]